MARKVGLGAKKTKEKTASTSRKVHKATQKGITQSMPTAQEPPGGWAWLCLGQPQGLALLQLSRGHPAGLGIPLKPRDAKMGSAERGMLLGWQPF